MTKELELAMPPMALGIACNKYQSPPFWKSMWALEWAGGAMMTSGGALTDSNRNNIVNWFLLETDLEWLFFIDDDIELPTDALRRLWECAMKYEVQYVTGVYYLRRPPYMPLIYTRQEDGWYTSLRPNIDYEVGDIVDIDASGMGCTLIHRSVFRTVLDNHFLYRRHNKSFGLMHYENVQTASTANLSPGVFAPADGGKAYIVQEIQPMAPEHLATDEKVPFFALEYGRTEDFHFCEMAKASGVRMLAHTGVEVKHWGEMPVDRSAYEQAIEFIRDNNAVVVDGNAFVPVEEPELV